MGFRFWLEGPLLSNSGDDLAESCTEDDIMMRVCSRAAYGKPNEIRFGSAGSVTLGTNILLLLDSFFNF